MVFAFQPQLSSFKVQRVCAQRTDISLLVTLQRIECPNTHRLLLLPFVLTYHRRSAPDTVLLALLSPLGILHKTEYNRCVVIVGVTQGKCTYYDRCSNFRNCYSTEERKREREKDREKKEFAPRRLNCSQIEDYHRFYDA